jgi:pyruvyl transferase EpsO
MQLSESHHTFSTKELTLMSLKQHLVCILNYFDRRQRCIYIDYPVHTNVGDLLINLGSEHFFAEHGLHIWRRYSYWDFPKRIAGITKNDVLLLHGGGNFGDLYSVHQRLRESIIKQYPDNRIIVLPQTVHFKSRDRESASIREIAKHRNLHVFARDYCSLERLQSGGLESCSAMPDMAHSLAGTLKPSTAVSYGTLHIIRCDDEGSGRPASLTAEDGPCIDWAGTFGKFSRSTNSSVSRFYRGMARYGPRVDLHRVWYWHRDRLIRDGINACSAFRTIVTNRLHVMLLGLLLDRRVIAFDNNYGKLSSYYDSWLYGSPSIEFHRTF